ncbi:MAG: M20 family metallopeptidase [Planctomycetota bacterium]|jgi:succinyl-diaminopimelate desuccinylase
MKKLLKNLVKADTTIDKGEIAAANILAQELALSGVTSEIDVWNHNRANIIANISSEKQKPALAFVCHLDVVPVGCGKWKFPPFEAVEQEGKIFGRGTTDMKAGIAAVITAIRQIVDSRCELKGDLIFLACAGEETDSCGVERFIEKNKDKLPSLAGVIVPEPTDFEVITTHRGLLWLKITTTGRAAHGSKPDLGINAISSMKCVLDTLGDYKPQFAPHPLLGDCSMSINTISGGQAINVIPDHCDIQIDIRTLPGQGHEQIVSDIEQILKELKACNPQFEAQVSVIRAVPALETEDCEFTRALCCVANKPATEAAVFCTDGPYFARLDVPTVVFGPGKPHLCHQPDEYIEIADLEKAVGHYKKIILEFLS